MYIYIFEQKTSLRPKTVPKIHFDHIKSQQLSVAYATKRCMLKQSKSVETWQTLKIAAAQPRNANRVSRQVIAHKDLGHAVKY